MPGEPWHTQIVEGYDDAAGELVVAIARTAMVWWPYLNVHLDAAGAPRIYMDGNAGLIPLALVSGFGVIDGALANINGNGETNVLVVGWTQADVDAAVVNAQSFGLTVVKTLRVSDNTISVP